MLSSLRTLPALLGCAAVAAAAQEPPVANEAREEARLEAASEEDDPSIYDPCALRTVEGGEWIDRLNRGLHRAVCESALWFDDLFGDVRVREDRRTTYGRVLLGATWDEQREWGDFTRFEVKVSLPTAERRFSLFAGRGDTERIVTGQSDVEEFLPPEGLEDDEWLVGLGYSPVRGERNGWSFGLGVDAGFPMNPVARARYRHRFFPGDETLVRVRPSLFWEREQGAGVATKVDVDNLLTGSSLFRWRTVGTWTEQTEGLEWYLELSIFQRLGTTRALAYQLGSTGETDREVPLREHFFRLIFRRRVARDWLFFDLRPGVAFRREQLADEREAVPFVSFGLEMLFGEREPAP